MQPSGRRVRRRWIYGLNITGAGIVEGANPVDNRGRPGAVDPVIDRMKGGQRPDVIALQEVCYEEFMRLKTYLTSVDSRSSGA